VSAPQRYFALRFVVVFLAALALVDLLAMLALVGVHAYSPAAVDTRILSPMTYILAGSSGVSLVLGASYAALAFPSHRKTIVLLSLIVVGVLCAHLYTINDPSLSAGSTLSGALGTSVHDGQLTVTSNVSGRDLTVDVSVSGTSAVSNLSLAVGGTVLPSSGFTTQPTPTAALQPGAQDKGSWSLPSAPSGDLTLNYQYLTCYDTGKQVDGCVMDEVYYVPAGQTLLSGEKCAPYADSCNLEHPYLSKAFVAAGIAIFGNDAFGWRIFEVILGTFSIPLIFGLALVIGKNERLALYAAFLLGFETLFFVHSSIAVIDVGAIFFALLGFLFYFANASWWKFDRLTLSGIAFGLAALSKETAIFLFLVLVLHMLFIEPGNRRQVAKSTLEFVFVVFIVFALGLQVYDGAFGAGTATTFLGQIDFILKYGASLTMTPTSQGWIDSTFHTPITPLNWITYYSPIGYLVTNVRVSSGAAAYSFVSIGYYGVTNQFEVWLVYIWGAYVAYLYWKNRGSFDLMPDSSELRLGGFALLWFLVVYVGYVGLYIYGRITYPYYFVAAVPALSLGAAYLLTRGWFPRSIAYIVLAGVFLWFFLFYPDKSFLPTQVRVWLGH
jgi:hypothetical protein